MKEIKNKITYNNYEVISIRMINKIIFVKTFNKETYEIIWFLGFKTKADLITDIKRILIEEYKRPNQFFKLMFNEDYIAPKIKFSKTKKEIL